MNEIPIRALMKAVEAKQSWSPLELHALFLDLATKTDEVADMRSALPVFLAKKP